MKLLEDKMTKKTKSTVRQIINKNVLKCSKGPVLRSRKVIYSEDEPYESSQDEMVNEKLKIHESGAIKHLQTAEKEEEQISKAIFIDKAISPIPNYNLQLKKERQLELFSDQQGLQDNPFQTPIKRKKRQSRAVTLIKVFHCRQFKRILWIDFLIYFRMLNKAKMFSTLLVNQFGQVIFADRLGSEHFQGSLNNFSRNPLQMMILECKMAQFFEKISQINAQNLTVLKLLIYSKNSKRRYSKTCNQISLTNEDIFNRYLKCISCQILPVEIRISSFQQIQGFWNKSLVEIDKPKKCFLFKVRLARQMPDLSQMDLKYDRKICKFIKYTERKQAEKKNETSQRNQSFADPHENHVPQIWNKKNKNYDISQLLSNRESDHIYEQMCDQVKHSKSVLTRGGVLNSGSKQNRQRE